jgi:acyl-CoA reductase-like NAD-dependent aldehyde dehydrogenase
MTHGELLIDGVPLGGAEDVSIEKVTIRAPYDEQVVGLSAVAGPAEVERAIAAAHRAFQTWRRSPRRTRRELLRAVASGVRDRSDGLVELLSREVGKPVSWSRGEVARLALTFDLAADLLSSYGGEWMPVDFDDRGGGYRCLAERFPVGPVLAIVPYNWPFNLAAHKVAPALAVGCTVILKASHQAPLSTLTLAHLIHEAGCPAGVLNGLFCRPTDAEAMALDERMSMVSFTGSPAVGRHLKALVPQKRVSLELGGDASALICADADLDFAVGRCVAGGYGYAGQVCIAVQHVLVHRAVYAEVRERLIAATIACPHGDPLDPRTVCGPLITSEAADKVMEWIEEARGAGAAVLAGASRSGRVVAPTLMERVPQTARLGCEEVFGPVLTLEPFGTIDEAISVVNASRYGLQCGVFTNDARIAEKAFREIEVGGVIVGDYPTLRFDNMPYGGVKLSGFGREGVRYAMDEMTELKTLLVRTG